MSAIRTERLGSGLILTIDRPAALGALDAECFEQIEKSLESARQDTAIQWLALRSNSPKAFCAGGDVRRLYSEGAQSGDLSYAELFFEVEYRVDQKIWDFPKPVIALTHGITMGGGIGLIRGATYRVVSPGSILAMPEISIGLYPDVGATFFLHTLPQAWRELVAFCGARAGPAEAIDWGLATHCIPESAHAPLLAQVAERGIHAAPEILKLHSVPAPRRLPARMPSSLQQALHAPDVSTLWDEATRLVSSADLAPEFDECLRSLLTGSPLSAGVVARQLELGGRFSRPQAFEWEFHASLACLRSGDFYEGVRARLVDKGSLPQWKYRHPREIPAALLSEITRIPS